MVTLENLKDETALQHLVREITEQVLDHQPPVLGVGQQRGAVEPGDGSGEEHVAPLDLDRRATAMRRKRLSRRAHLGFEQCDQDEPLRSRRKQAAGHRVAHQAAAAEDDDRSITQVHAVARSRGSRAA